MKSHNKHIHIRAEKVEALRIGNNKAVVSYIVKTAKGFTYYDVTLDREVVAATAGAIEADRPLERVLPRAWVHFSDRDPTEQGEYVIRYHNHALCTFPTLESLMGAYKTYGAFQWFKLP
jgi:hypothetical protein